MSHPQKIFELAKSSNRVAIPLDGWLRGQIDWERCLNAILGNQIEHIRALIEKYNLEDMHPENFQPFFFGNEESLVKQQKLIEAIECADVVERGILACVEDYLRTHSQPILVSSLELPELRRSQHSGEVSDAS